MLRRLLATTLTVQITMLLLGCPGTIRPSSRNVTLEVLGAAVTTVGGWTVLPAGSNPSFVAAASNKDGISSLRLTGKVSVGCGHGPSEPVRLVNKSIEIGAEPGASTSTINVVRQLNLDSGEQRRICAEPIGTPPSSPTAAGATGTVAGELLATAVFKDSDVPESSPVLRFRTRTIQIANLNIVGSDETATSPAYGLGTFAERLDGLSAALADFDIVALQEVASADQVRQLAERAGFPHYAAYPDLGFISRWELKDVQQLVGDKPGCVLGINCGGEVHIHVATINAHGRPVRVVNTHLSGDYSPQGLDRSSWRAAQAKQIREKVVEPFPGPVIVVGDFNGNDDLAAPKGPLRDAYLAPWKAVARNSETGQDTDHCGDRIELILIGSPLAPIAYDGVFGRCPQLLGLSDHPRVSALLAP